MRQSLKEAATVTIAQLVEFDEAGWRLAFFLGYYDEAFDVIAELLADSRTGSIDPIELQNVRYNQALTEFSRGNIADSVRLYTSILSTRPSRSDVLMVRSSLHQCCAIAPPAAPVPESFAALILSVDARYRGTRVKAAKDAGVNYGQMLATFTLHRQHDGADR